MVLGESYQPVARKRVAPIGVGDANGGYISISIRISIAYSINYPHAGITYRKQPCRCWQGIEHQREVYLTVLRYLDGLPQFHTYGVLCFVGLTVGLE